MIPARHTAAITIQRIRLDTSLVLGVVPEEAEELSFVEESLVEESLVDSSPVAGASVTEGVLLSDLSGTPVISAGISVA